jgi:hypothetical protein
MLDNDFIEAAKETGKDIRITIRDEHGIERYSWTFNSENLKKSLLEGRETELALKLISFSEVKRLDKLLGKVEGLVIHFGHNGELPSQASVSIYVGDREGVKPGSRIYLYYYNVKTNKLETLPGGFSYKVDDEGFITVDILHCSDYVILFEEAGKTQYTSLRNQIKVTVEDRVIYTGSKNKPNVTHMNIVLPQTLELVKSLEDETLQSAIGGVTVAYKSTNKAVAIIDEKGIITAKGEGITTIITKITLYSGKVKTSRTVVIVRKQVIN